MHNIYNFTSPKIGKEALTPLYKTEGVFINQIVSNRLERSEWYMQQESEWLVLIEGMSSLEFDDKTLSLKKGDTLFIPAMQRHRVLTTSTDALWITVHMG